MRILLIIFAFYLAPLCTFSQSSDDLKQLIISKDSLFWSAYNRCDLEGMKQFFTPDAEFYHDKGGIELGAETILEITRKNLCSNTNFRLRRELVPGTLQIFPMKNNDTIYGAILNGSHRFYVNETGKPERLDGQAYFSTLWLLRDGVWRMHRILSYDHGPAAYVNQRAEIKGDPKKMKLLEGNYKGQESGAMTVTIDGALLRLQIGEQRYMLHAMSANVFFTTDRDLEFEFIKTSSGKVSEMVVKEHGNVVERARRVD